jgi:hypothetical protein
MSSALTLAVGDVEVAREGGDSAKAKTVTADDSLAPEPQGVLLRLIHPAGVAQSVAPPLASTTTAFRPSAGATLSAR